MFSPGEHRPTDGSGAEQGSPMTDTTASESSPETSAAPRPKRPLRRLLRLCQWTVNLCFFPVAVLAFTPLGYRLGRTLIAVDPIAKSDYIVVLGGDNSRAVEAAQLYREGWAPKVIVTSNRDAKLLGAVAKAYGVPEAALLIDETSRRTAYHPGAVGKLEGIDKRRSRLIVVTTAFHTSRAKACFVRAGYRNIRMRIPRWEAGGEYEAPRRGFTSPIRDLPAIIYELLAWVRYKLSGWV